MKLPEGLRDTDDVATSEVAAHALVHVPGDILTGCRQPMWAMHRSSAGHMATLSCRWCPSCWPQQATARASTWARLLDLAHPDRPFGFINSSSRLAGHPLNERSR